MDENKHVRDIKNMKEEDIIYVIKLKEGIKYKERKKNLEKLTKSSALFGP